MRIDRVVLALGANLGDRGATLARCRDLIQRRIGPILDSSRLLKTKAWGREDQPDFLNQVLAAQPAVLLENNPAADLPALLNTLLATTQSIERDLGRTPGLFWGPRTCDVDIVFVDDHSYSSQRLTIPHPWWARRYFVGGLLAADLPQYLPAGTNIRELPALP